MEYETREIGGIRCKIWTQDRGGPIIYWGAGVGGDEQGENVARLMAGSLGKRPWRLVSWEAQNWNRDYSPWALPDIKGREGFSGGARETLAWLTDICIPFVEKENGAPCAVSQRMIGGYSLAGLFSLFAFYESRMFGGAASLSGSLWYPGWKEYAEKQKSPEGSCIYVSLGRKEEKTRNREMATVGQMTRWQYEQVQQDANVHKSQLVWHEGGHFTNVEERIAKGFIWLIEGAK